VILGLLNRRPPPRVRARLTVETPSIVYAIGDVHGCFAQLQSLLKVITDDAAAIQGPKLIVTLGDYVDRGPQSAAVLDWICSPPPPTFQRISLAGNHEAMMLDFLDDPRTDSPWLRYGGIETLRSYGVDTDAFLKGSRRDRTMRMAAAIPAEHVQTLLNLPAIVTMAEAVFVHAGIRPGIALEQQREEDLLWIREPFLGNPGADGPLVVHGHTPGTVPVQVGRRICVDTGAFATGVLTALRLHGNQVSFLQSAKTN
jgi:serine/threonine protein phosphatase 1